MTGPALTALAESLPSTVPFVGPEALERARGERFAARLGANESVFGPSPVAIEAIRAAAGESWMYGDPELHELKAALAAHEGVAPENIVVGEGVDGLLGYTARLFVEPGVAVVTSLGAYPTFNYHVAGYGGRLVTVPYREDREDLEALVDTARREKARLVYVANPDNPMGLWQSGPAIEAAIEALPDSCLMILDEAYIEMAPPGAAPRIPVDRPNVLRFRSFSKIHGLAGLRVGFGVGAAPLIRAFDKIRNHFGVGRIAQAGALGALSDSSWVATVNTRIAESRARIAAIAGANELRPLSSATNFVAIDCGRDGVFARAVQSITFGFTEVFTASRMSRPARSIEQAVSQSSSIRAFFAAMSASTTRGTAPPER